MGDEENEETIDATEIHENLMDTTPCMFACFSELWVIWIFSGTDVSHEVDDPDGTQEPTPITEGYNLFIIVLSLIKICTNYMYLDGDSFILCSVRKLLELVGVKCSEKL